MKQILSGLAAVKVTLRPVMSGDGVSLSTLSTDSFACPISCVAEEGLEGNHAHSLMTLNNHVVRPLAARGVALLLYVVLLPATGIVAQPVRERLPVRELSYVVEPIIQGESCRLRVSLTFQGDASGNSRLLLPLEWAEGTKLYRFINNLQASSADTKIENTKE